jgi:hypothetical protein
VLQTFWGDLESTAVTEELQPSALKHIVSLARNVQTLDIAALEALLSKVSTDAAANTCTLLKTCCGDQAVAIF